jgi:hypothetical protein
MKIASLSVMLGLETTNKANPCATKGATYLFHSVENPSGTCGQTPDQIVNINADGTLATALSCTEITQNGCVARDTDCVTTSKDGQTTCYATTSVTFADDGASASGLISIRCSSTADSSSCSSTYGVSARRQ